MNAIAVSPDGTPLGLCSQQFWCRQGKVPRRKNDRRAVERRVGDCERAVTGGQTNDRLEQRPGHPKLSSRQGVDADVGGQPAEVRARVAAGETVFDQTLVKPSLAGERNRLTPRELEVLQLICDGLSNKDIAARLKLSVNTVAVHRANIMNTLGVHKTAELVVYALQHGLVNPL